MRACLLNDMNIAFGCDDMAAPSHAWVNRDRDTATVGCYHSDYEWKMSCVGSKWIGPRSNCTDKKPGRAISIPYCIIHNINIIVLIEFLAATMNTTTFLKESYLKTAFDYAIGYQIMETLSPGSLKRMEKNMAKNGQEFLLTKPSTLFKGF